MPLKMIILVVILILSAGYAYHDYYQLVPVVEPVTQDNLPRETKTIVPDFSFVSLDGDEHNLHDFKGKVILLNFWASWCVPCVVEFPALLELATLREDKVVLIALSVDTAVQNIERFFKKHQFNIDPENVIVAHDMNKSISQDLFQTTLYPETFIIAPDLTIQKKITGMIDWTSDSTLSMIDKNTAGD